MANISTAESFFNKSYLTRDGCWQWTASKNQKGYGRFWDGKKQVFAHRWIYEQMVETIQEGLQLDHLCRNRACVNFDHLEPVTGAENTRRGLTGKINNFNGAKTHCKRGHEFTIENTYIPKHPKIFRRCRKCRNLFEMIRRNKCRRLQ